MNENQIAILWVLAAVIIVAAIAWVFNTNKYDRYE